MRGFLRRTLHPERYHGHGRVRGPFFEGWYYKLVDARGEARFAIIPGIFLGDQRETDEAFVQVLDGQTGAARYFAYEVDAFQAAADRFDVRVGRSRFRHDRIELDLEDAEGSVRGELRLGPARPWPVTLSSPGIMGWYAWVPRMECYHGVLSFDHEVQGTLHVDGEPHGFDGGRGYTEKDWGVAFPAAYAWLQTNHFETPGTSLTASVALIPWLRRSFRGFIAGLLHEGRLYRFATYTGARISALEIDEKQVTWSLVGRHHCLELRARRAAGGLLKSPVRTQMHRRVEETLSASVEVRLSERRGGRVIFEGWGRHAGLEVHGDLARLV